MMSAAEIWKYITVDQAWIGLSIVIILFAVIYLMYKKFKRMREDKVYKSKPKDKVVSPLNMEPDLNAFAGFDMESRDRRGYYSQKNNPEAILSIIRNKAELLHGDMEVTKQNLSKELEEVRQFKKEIYELVDAMRVYYGDLARKESILAEAVHRLGYEKKDSEVEKQ